MSVPVVQCRATSRTEKQCKNKAIPGCTVCRFHGGASPHVASRPQCEQKSGAGLGDTTVDPGEVLLSKGQIAVESKDEMRKRGVPATGPS